jgi:iron complex transport system substrate-binding protein
MPGLAALLMAAACQSSAPAAPVLRPAAPRIVSLHDVTTEIVVALGAGDRLVGVAEAVEMPAPARAAVARVPRVEGVESILAVRPSLVLGMEVVARRSPELVRFLRGKGLDVWLGHPGSLEDVLGLVSAIGQRAGATAQADVLLAGLRARIGQARPVAEPVRVFVYDCCDPAFTAGRGAVLTDLIRRAGGRNIFDDLATDWTKVSWEQVIARRPQLIVVHDYAWQGQGDVAGKRRRLAALRALAGVPVTVMPLGFSLGGLRSIEGLEQLRRVIGAQGGRG